MMSLQGQLATFAEGTWGARVPISAACWIQKSRRKNKTICDPFDAHMSA
jgi:hypothetical protein